MTLSDLQGRVPIASVLNAIVRMAVQQLTATCTVCLVMKKSGFRFALRPRYMGRHHRPNSDVQCYWAKVNVELSTRQVDYCDGFERKLHVAQADPSCFVNYSPVMRPTSRRETDVVLRLTASIGDGQNM